MPKVAVITRTQNRPLLLERAIQSVINQTFTDWVMVIVNDAGEKTCVDNLVKKYQPQAKGRIKVIHNEKSNGMEAASNTGIKNSISKYVIIHDDDDSWRENFLEVTVNELEEKGYKGVITHSIWVSEIIKNNKVRKIIAEPFNNQINNITIYRMAVMNVFPPISFIFRRDVFDEIGYFDETLPVLGDWDFNLRFIEKYDIPVIPQLLAYYHHRPSTTNDEYSNTVNGERQKQHFFYDTYLRNKMLREDMKNNRIGMGHIVNQAFSIEKGFIDADIKRKAIYQSPELSDNIQKNIDMLKKEYANKDIYFYGAGEFLTKDIFGQYNLSGLNIKGIFDKDQNKQGKEINGIKVYHPDNFKNHKIDLLVVSVLSSGNVFGYLNENYKGNIFYINSL